MHNNDVRLIALYLPQYHPIPENDEWWGKGFTEWTNVAKAQPLFKGHYQPHLPADLGFYDLRVPEVREAQAELAREHGIEGFCYWHYWFAGKRLLEKPFKEVLRSGKPDFPFCLAWANETWTGIWHGNPDKVLIQQTYPGEQDHEQHFYEVLPAFQDHRYIRIDGKPVFVIYYPGKIPMLNRFVDLWQNLAQKNGLKGIYFLGFSASERDYHDAGLEGVIKRKYLDEIFRKKRPGILHRQFKRVTHQEPDSLIRQLLKHPRMMSYKDFIADPLPYIDPLKDQFPEIMPNWDNTPRSHINGYVLQNSSPDLFRVLLEKAISLIRNRDWEKRIVFLKSWNEWAEGNYLEPDQRFGKGYLEVIKEVVQRIESI